MADPTVRATAGDAFTPDQDEHRQAIFTNYNDAIALTVDGQSMIGRSDATAGPAKKIVPVNPLLLQDGQLYVNIAVLQLQIGMLWKALAINAAVPLVTGPASLGKPNLS